MSLTESNGQRLTTLGGLHLKPKGFQRPKLLLLLTYLALEHGKSREHLRTLFWAGATDVSASLRVALAQIRNALPNALEDSGSIVLTRIPCDAVDLQTALDASDWERAVNLYTGAFLDGIMLSEFGNELEEWVLTTREYLAGRVVEAHLRLAEQALGHNDLENVKRHANQAHKLPGAPPPEEDTLTRLHNILNAIKSPSAAELRREAAELGLELSTAATAASIAPAPTNLPAPINSFIARETERRYLLETLKDPEARLVTVTGVGGIGKSRLALEVARQLHRENRFKDGVFVAFLEVIESVYAVVSELLRVLQVPMESGQDLQNKLLEHLKNTEILLMLDNLEHLIPFAGQLERMLLECPKLKVLTTSRERLGLTAEWLLPLEGLPILDKSEANPDTPYGAVELFAARAKRQAPAFSLATQHDSVLEICRLVEGLPLAIELAAALIQTITLPELTEAIRQHPDTLEGAINDPHERHNGMRAVFEQSWKLLTPIEKRTLAKMTIFKESITRDAVIYVTETNLMILVKLTKKSLVQFSINGYYRIHPILKQYGIEKLKLNKNDEKLVQEKHQEYFLILLEKSLKLFHQSETSKGLNQIENNYEDIRFAWLEGVNYLDKFSFQKFQDFVLYFDIKVREIEGIFLFQELINKIEKQNLKEECHLLCLATFLVNKAWLLFRLQNSEEAYLCAKKAVDLVENLGISGRKILSKAFNTIGNILVQKNDFKNAIYYSKKALRLSKLDKDMSREGICLINLANLESQVGLDKKSHQHYKKALDICKSINDIPNIISTCLNFGHHLLYIEDNKNKNETRHILEYGLSLAMESKIESMEQHIHLYLAHFFTEIQEFDSAIHHAESAYKISLSLKDTSVRIGALLKFGYINYEKKNYYRAFCIFFEALNESLIQKNPTSILDSLVYLIKIFILNEDSNYIENILLQIYFHHCCNLWHKQMVLKYAKSYGVPMSLFIKDKKISPNNENIQQLVNSIKNKIIDNSIYIDLKNLKIVNSI